MVKDWKVIRRPPEPADFWSQSFCWGDVTLPPVSGPVQVRFSNNGNRSYRKVEAYLVYEVQQPSPTQVTFCWQEGDGPAKTASRTFAPGQEDASWEVTTGVKTRTLWVEYATK